ncbi:methyltransferase domain-containing protein [Alphaproteobacteria bacterium]|nr:methyltransferase domain-containing protein [Alphaproteobacteria bacterium]
MNWKDGGTYDPRQYAIHDDATSTFIQYVIKKTESSDTVLDIGCNQGRFLRTLSENGYNKLYGVDVMCNAIRMLRDYSVENGKKINAKCATIQEYLPTLNDGSMDYCITYSATIELVHPGFNLFKELNRVCDKGFIFALNESGHTYPRFYRLLALIHGFNKIETFKLTSDLTVLYFEKK